MNTNKRERKITMKKLIALSLILTLCLAVFGCAKPETPETTAAQVTESTEAQTAPDLEETTIAEVEAVEIGEGENNFIFTAVFEDGTRKVYNVSTGKKTVGEALLELELIAGDEGDYGLYVKTVDGVTADYDTDGSYWAFYIDGAYAQTGVDATEISNGTSYEMRIETAN